MGIVKSTMGDYSHIHYMDTDMTLHYYLDQISMAQKFQWAGAMQAQAAQAATGAGFGAQTSNQYMMMTGFWRKINYGINRSGYLLIPVSLAAVALCFATRASGLLFFLSAFFLLFFLIHALMYKTAYGIQKSIYSTLVWLSLIISTVLSSIAVGVYIVLFLNNSSESYVAPMISV